MALRVLPWFILHYQIRYIDVQVYLPRAPFPSPLNAIEERQWLYFPQALPLKQ